MDEVTSFVNELRLKRQEKANGHSKEPFLTTLSPSLFLAMAPNLNDAEFVERSAELVLGRRFDAPELEYWITELASLSLARNEYLSILRYSAEGKAVSSMETFSLKFWRYYILFLKAANRIPRLGPKLVRVFEIPRLLSIISRVPRRLQELEIEIHQLCVLKMEIETLRRSSLMYLQKEPR